MAYESLQILVGKALNGMPSMVAFAGALGIVGIWIGGLIGIFLSWPPFQDLELDLLIGAILPQRLGGIILSNRYKNPNKQNWNIYIYISEMKNPTKTTLLWEKNHTKTRKKMNRG